MNYYLLNVQRNGWAVNSRPRLQFHGHWLDEAGFVNGALVQSLPGEGVLVLTLCDKDICYSELYKQTKAEGGTLNRAYVADSRTLKGPALITTGKHISKAGFVFGDSLVARYEYGRIEVRKVLEGVRLINVARTKDARTKSTIPSVFMTGSWLDKVGFGTDVLMTVSVEAGVITLQAYNKEIIYSDIVKLARKNKWRFVQVSARDGLPRILFKGFYIAEAGFLPGDIFAAYVSFGQIRLQKFEPECFGFCLHKDEANI